jgi:fatty acid desaturase
MSTAAEIRVASPVKRPALTREQLSRLTRCSNVPTGLMVLFVTAGICATFWMVESWPNPLTFCLAFLLIGGFQHHLSIIQHEAVHYLLFTNKATNDFFGHLAAASTGFTMAYREVHFKHHRELGMDTDPDLHNYKDYPGSIEYVLQDAFINLFGAGAAIQFVKMTLGNKNNKTTDPAVSSAAAAAAAAQKKSTTSNGRAGTVIVLLMQALIFTALTASGHWYLYLFLWILPLVTLTKSLAHYRNVVEHTLIKDKGDAEVSRYRTIYCNWIEQFLFAPLNFNYHAEHHIYPSIPFYHLPAAHEEMLQHNRDYEKSVDLQNGYLRFLIEHSVR